jgi:hypothetical protein
MQTRKTHKSCSEVEKAINELKDKKATEGDVDDDVHGVVLKLLGEDYLKIMTQLINNIYETGEWPKDFTGVTITALKKNLKAKKCSDHHTISLITHTAMILAKILRRRILKES